MNALKQRFILIFLLLGGFYTIHAQDSLVLSNNDIIVGELKEMNKSVAVMETDYSDSDFKIEWDEIKRIHTKAEFLISVFPGEQYDGQLISGDSTQLYIVKQQDTIASTTLDKIFFIREVKAGFLSRFSGELSVGYNMAKAENLSEFSIRSRLAYRAKRWTLSGKYDDIRSSRDNTDPVKRVDAALNYQYFLKRNWFTVTEVSWLSNTEQDIKLRTLGKIGVGKLLAQSKKLYWGLQAGATYNNETYNTTTGTSSQNSAEAFLGTELNLFDVKDFSLLTKATVYPSLTESNRWRFDYGIDLKYDLPLNFFVKLGFTFNYDSQPINNASNTDYIFQTTIGWDFN